MWGLVIAEFALVFGISAAINRLSLTTATLMFVAYSVINGALLSSIFLIYTATSITSASSPMRLRRSPRGGPTSPSATTAIRRRCLRAK